MKDKLLSVLDYTVAWIALILFVGYYFFHFIINYKES